MAIKLNGDTLQYDDLGGNVSTIATLSNDALAMASGSQLEVADLHVGGNLTVLGTQTLGDAEADSLAVSGDAVFSNGLTASAGITPAASDGAALGSAALEWSDLYLADGAVAYFGDDQEVTLTHIDDTGLRLNGAMKLQFRDATEFVQSDADGYMHMEGATGVNLAINGTNRAEVTSAGLNVVGTITGDTSLTIDAVTLTDTELGYLDGLTLGTAAASKVMTWDASSDWTAAGGTCADLGTVTTVDINGGTVDNTVIGGATPLAGTFTDLTVSGKLSGSNGFRVSDGGAMAVMSLNDTDGFDLTVTSATVTSNMAVTGALNVTGNFVCDSDILPDEDGAGDLGSTSLQWAEAHVDHGYIDAITATGTSTLTTVDINGGNIDGTIIGAASVAAGSFAAVVGTTGTYSSTLTANGDVDLGNATSDTITCTGQFDSDLIPSTDSARDLGTSAKQWAEAHIDAGYIDDITAIGTSTLTTVDINGGNIDGTAIGVASAANGTFLAAVATTISGSTSVSAPKYTTHGGGTFVVDADTDYLTFNEDQFTFANNVDVKARSYITYSDATLKKDIKPLDNALDKVMSMRGVSYEFKQDSGKEAVAHREVGFLAQEMKQTVPEVVYGSGDGNLGIDYAKLTSVLVEAVKSQQNQIEELRAALLKK